MTESTVDSVGIIRRKATDGRPSLYLIGCCAVTVDIGMDANT